MLPRRSTLGNTGPSFKRERSSFCQSARLFLSPEAVFLHLTVTSCLSGGQREGDGRFSFFTIGPDPVFNHLVLVLLLFVVLFILVSVAAFDLNMKVYLSSEKVFVCF